MEFAHCDTSSAYLSLHDCIAEKAYFADGKLGFLLSDGFWISPDHPESDLSALVRTDAAKVEYTLEDGEDYDVTVYVFERTLFGRTMRVEWPLQTLLEKLNSGTCKLEFIYRYTDGCSEVMECDLHYDRRPYRKECVLKISAPQVRYFWNRLCKDRTW